MTRDLDLAHLRTLLAIEEEGSFGAAAKRVGRTQSAVTQQMQALEETVRKKLFVSNGRQRELTTAGHVLLRNSREILSLCSQTISATQNLSSSTVLRLGSPLEVADEFLPGLLKSFAARWPQTRVVLHINRSKELMEMLSTGALDLTFSTWRSGAGVGQSVRQMPVYWVASPAFDLNIRKPLPLVLTNEPSVFRRICLSALDLAGWPYEERITTYNTAGVRFAVEAGLGLTARTKTAFRPDVKVFKPDSGLPPLPAITYYLHKSIHSEKPEVDDLFEAIIDECAKEESGA